MAFADDVADLIAAEVSHIGLGLDATTEVTGNGYSAQVPTYPAASGGSTDLSATLEFDGPVNSGPVTHLFYKRAGTLWIAVEVDTPQSFNSDGRLNVTSAEVSSALGA